MESFEHVEIPGEHDLSGLLSVVYFLSQASAPGAQTEGVGETLQLFAQLCYALLGNSRGKQMSRMVSYSNGGFN